MNLRVSAAVGPEPARNFKLLNLTHAAEIKPLM